MADFPHVYTTNAMGTHDPILKLSSEKLPEMQVSPPVEFGGPEGYWNPEAFFSASISTCFILTFKSIARAMRLEWNDINVDVDAYLDKKEGQLSFTKVDIFVTLKIPQGKEVENYQKALVKAEGSCLITNSIKSEIKLHPVIQEI
jgi:organic hydroperoxide reductase OsmC/OhrA